jgi:hypothetical protein
MEDTLMMEDKEFDFRKSNVSPDFDLEGFNEQIISEYNR